MDEVQFDSAFCFKYSPRPHTPALKYQDSISEDEKSRRLQILMERQREIQRANYARHLGSVLEVMIEGENAARGQWIGRTSQNKTLNFSVPNGSSVPGIGQYVQARVTRTLPNSLVGEMV
jgi:tRNA-2-methylthio-N6-dimethylallyladenosine synthase